MSHLDLMKALIAAVKDQEFDDGPVEVIVQEWDEEDPDDPFNLGPTLHLKQGNSSVWFDFDKDGNLTGVNLNSWQDSNSPWADPPED